MTILSRLPSIVSTTVVKNVSIHLHLAEHAMAAPIDFVIFSHHFFCSDNFETLVQPALGVLMIAALAGNFFKEEENPDMMP